MARLGVPVVEGDLIVRDQEWATPQQDGRHYPMLVPVEVCPLLSRRSREMWTWWIRQSRIVRRAGERPRGCEREAGMGPELKERERDKERGG